MAAAFSLAVSLTPSAYLAVGNGASGVLIGVTQTPEKRKPNAIRTIPSLYDSPVFFSALGLGI